MDPRLNDQKFEALIVGVIKYHENNVKSEPTQLNLYYLSMTTNTEGWTVLFIEYGKASCETV